MEGGRGAHPLKCILFNTGDRVKYYDPSIYRLPGEWIFIQCNSHPELQAQLIFKPNGTNKTHRVYHDKKVLGQRNTNNFNITCLSYKDSGQYTCTINLGIHEKTKHKLIVLREGKFYIDHWPFFVHIYRREIMRELYLGGGGYYRYIYYFIYS